MIDNRVQNDHCNALTPVASKRAGLPGSPFFQLSKGRTLTDKPSVILGGVVEKIVEFPGHPEMAQIAIDGTGEMYTEIRIEKQGIVLSCNAFVFLGTVQAWMEKNVLVGLRRRSSVAGRRDKPARWPVVACPLRPAGIFSGATPCTSAGLRTPAVLNAKTTHAHPDQACGSSVRPLANATEQQPQSECKF